MSAKAYYLAIDQGGHSTRALVFDQAGQKHMQYLKYRGDYQDIPYDRIIAAFRKNHPLWLANRD